MNDIHRLLTAAALVTFTGVGCSSSHSSQAGGIGISPAANDPQFESPFDATPDPDGKVVYFTALSVADAAPGVFKVGADGTGLTKLFAGDPLVSPFGIAISDDGQTLFIADTGAEDDNGELGAVFSLGTGGGTPSAMAGTQGTLPKGIEAQGDSVYYTGITTGATPAPAVFKMPLAGGSPTPIVSGAPLVDPSGVAVTKAGDVFVLDTSSSDANLANVFKVTGGAPSQIGGNIMVGYPSGIALSADDSTVIVSALDPDAMTDTVFTFNITTGAQSTLGDTVQKTIGQFGDSAGLHRSRNGGVFAWADGKGNQTGTVYVLK